MKLFGNYRGASRVAQRESKQQGKYKMPVWKSVLIVVLSVLLMLEAVLIVFLGIVVRAPEPVRPSVMENAIDPDTNELIIQGDPNEVHKEDFYNILIAGTDNDGLRTDVIMIARLDTKSQSVALMSIPRDSIVETRNGISKINSVYGTYGCGKNGMEALMLEVEDLLGFLPSGYILVNLDGFMELVDTIGGIYFDVPQDMYHNDPTQDLYIDLKAGYQHLDGNKAMQLVRFRGYDAADIQRTKVQQQFLISVAKQCVSLSNLGKISDYVDIFSRNVTTNFSTGNLLYFAQEISKCDFENMVTYTLPGDSVWMNGSYYRLDEAEIRRIVDESFNPYVNGTEE